MTLASWSLARALSPTPAQARSWLTQELHSSDYHGAWLDSLGRWISDLMAKILQDASHVAGLSSAIAVLIALAVITVLVWVLPKVRRERVVAPTDMAVLADQRITPGQYRDLAAQALREGRYDDAVLEAFRAIAKDMSDRGVIDDAPGRTAHEVSLALTSPFPDHADRLVRAANLFDSVRYGQRRPSPSQAGQVRDLDAELARTRPLLSMSSPAELPL
jgi:hypothetical protein